MLQLAQRLGRSHGGEAASGNDDPIQKSESSSWRSLRNFQD